MPKRTAELSALAVKRFVAKPPTAGTKMYAVGGVVGLYLQTGSTGAASWILRTMVGDRRRDIGLGSYPSVTLAKARDDARAAREKITEGIDPVAEKRAARSALIAQQAGALTFDQCAERYIAAHEKSWRNPKHAGQWTATLATYASPHLGNLLVRDVGVSHVMAVLEDDDLWKIKTETASRLRGRIETVLDWATTRGYREGLNPARWKGHLDKLLPAPRKVTKVVHHAALGWREIGPFIARLRNVEGIGARALELAILCASRSGEIRGATWGEFDLDAGVWTIPEGRMKAMREHRVPLSSAALDLLHALPNGEPDAVVFPGMKGRPLSDATLGAVLKRMGLAVTAHGFRSTFRDWAGESTGHPSDVVEAALAHTIGSKVQQAYQRGDLFEKRRALMADWADYCNGVA